MNIKDPIELMVEFIAPYEDNLNILMIGDTFNPSTQSEFNKALNKTRRSLPGSQSLEPLTISISKPSELYHGKNSITLKDNICIVITDAPMSNNIISFLTNNLQDDMEGMLIDKYIMDVPQEKYIFDISQVDDDTLAQLCQNMDKKSGAYNYLIVADYLGIWILYNDEFTLLQNTL